MPRRYEWDYLSWLLLGSACAYVGLVIAAGVALAREGVRIKHLLLLAAAAGSLLYLLVTLTVDARLDRDDDRQ